MKFLQKFIRRIKPSFEEGGKYEKFGTAFNAFESFLFVPGHATLNGSHIRDAIDLKRTMSVVVIAMLPAMLFGMWNTGYQHYAALGNTAGWLDCFLFGLEKVLPIIVVSYVSGLAVEFIFASFKKHPVNEGFLVTGLLIPKRTASTSCGCHPQAWAAARRKRAPTSNSTS